VFRQQFVSAIAKCIFQLKFRRQQILVALGYFWRKHCSVAKLSDLMARIVWVKAKAQVKSIPICRYCSTSRLYSEKYSCYAVRLQLHWKKLSPAWITIKTSWEIVWLRALWKQQLSLARIFQVTLKSTKDLCIYMAKQGKHILKNLKIAKLLMLSLIRLFRCELEPAG